MKTLVLYHQGCPDGMTAAWAVRKFLGDEAEYVPVSYPAGGSDVVMPDVKGRDVFFVDFCPPPAQLGAIHSRAADLLVLDHHESAEKNCGDLPYTMFDLDRSGATIAWDYFSDGEPRPWIVDYAEDRDLFRFDLPDSRAVNAYVMSGEYTLERWDRLAKLSLEEARERGEVVLEKIAGYIAYQKEHVRMVSFQGHEVPTVNAPQWDISDLLHEIQKGYAFAVGWFQRGDGLYQYSLRSDGGVRVNDIAAKFGGGGHPAAAGFCLSREDHIDLGIT